MEIIFKENEICNKINEHIEKLKEELSQLRNTALKIVNVESVSNVTRRSMHYQKKTKSRHKNSRLISEHNEPIEIILELQQSSKLIIQS